MALLYDESLRSQPFRFLVGPDREEFFLHPVAVAKQSETLSALVNGSMKEAKERCALLEDIDPKTFVRFGEYIYTGSYTAAEHSVIIDSIPRDEDLAFGSLNGSSRAPATGTDRTQDLPLETEISEEVKKEEEAQGNDDPWRAYAGLSKVKMQKKKKGIDWGFSDVKEDAHIEDRSSASITNQESRKQQSWAAFKNLKYYSESKPETPKIRANKEPCEDYSEVFLSHAQVYAFAEKYGIDNLKNLALTKLHATLVEFTLYDERIPDVTRLLRYTYDNTPDLTHATDKLRMLVIKYVSYHIKKVVDDDIFVDLMTSACSISIDLAKDLIQRLD